MAWENKQTHYLECKTELHIFVHDQAIMEKLECDLQETCLLSQNKVILNLYSDNKRNGF
jgi:hypothetical protein